jgi:NAD-dependent DNA ligase
MAYRSEFNYRIYMKYGLDHFRDEDHELEVCENLLWEHRYRYYVLDNPVVTDIEYDRLDKRLVELYNKCQREPPESSVVNTVGSSLKEAYPENIRKYFEGGKSV